MVRRREARVRTVLPVRVFGMDSSGKPFTSLAHTLDIASGGARLSGLQHPLNIGDIVGVQRGTDKARYRVAWVGTAETHNASQVGLECVQENRNIWNIIFEESGPDTFDISQLELRKSPQTLAAAPTTQERRRSPRYPSDIGLEMQVRGSDVLIYARCTDISRGGCYVETRSPMPVSTKLYICLKTDSRRVRALAEVRNSHPSMGMGLHFDELGEDDLGHLLAILEELDRKKPADLDAGAIARLRDGIASLQRIQDDLARYMLNPSALRTLQTAITIARETLECCSHTLQQHASSELLSQALFIGQLRNLQNLVADFVSNLPHTLATPVQLSTLRSVAESLLQRIPDSSVTPPLDKPFIAVSNSRPM